MTTPMQSDRAVNRRSAWFVVLLAGTIVLTACGGESRGGAPSSESRVQLTAARETSRAADARILALLRKDGAHLAQPRSTRLYLDFSTHAEARDATAEIPRAYRVEDLGKAGAASQYVLRLTTTMVISLDSIGRREAALTTIAGHHHGTLDGWEAAPTP